MCPTGNIALERKAEVSLTLLDRIPILGHCANSCDLVQMPQNMASELGLYCLLAEISMEKTVKKKTFPRNP